MPNPKFSKREKEVTTYLLEGKSNKQIAHKLGVSVRTVEFHLSNIYARLNTRSRTEAVIKLTELNLRKTAGKNTSKVLRKSTVTKKGQRVENGGNQIKRRFPMKNLLIGITAGVLLTVMIMFAVSYVNTNGGAAVVIGGATPTLIPFETPTPVPFGINDTATPIPMNVEETATPLPMTVEPTSTPFPTKKP
ncbi:MAG: response regulator transcription factor [Anaerolineales bacterium]|nr:response regulator transcription factor [Anaerolineales bacterium]